MNDITAQLTERLRSSTVAGDLAGAYALIQTLDVETVKRVALAGGYSMIFSKKKKELMTHVQGEIAKASRNRCDGWGLRNLPASH